MNFKMLADNKIFYILLDAFERLHKYCEKNNFKGYELDDYLASPIVRFFTFNNLFLMRVAIQIGKHLPINLRPLLFIKKTDSYKARAFFIEGALNMYELTGDNKWKEQIIQNLLFLKNNYNKNYKGYGWGNHFDFASRGGFFPKFIPTIVWTSKVADAAFRVYKVISEFSDICKEIVIQASNFIVYELERIEDDTGFCFAYAPGLLNPIHNSNLLGAATVMKAIHIEPGSHDINIVKKSLSWSLSKMNPDGSWYYGETKKYKWIDNFHTAYILDSLIDIYEIDATILDFMFIEKTYNYWINNFFTDKGQCKYYNNKLYPIDIQSVAQAIETLSKMTKYFTTAKVILEKILLYSIKNLQNKDGSFAYQIRKFWINRIPYIHWGQSTMYAALTYAMKVYYENSNS